MSEQLSTNPLLQFDRLPDFPAIKAGHIQPAVDYVLENNRKQLAEILGSPINQTAPDWHSLMDPLDDMDDNLNKLWSTASHLNSVVNTPEIREAYTACQAKISEYYSEMGQNEQLYQCVQALYARADELRLDGSQRKILEDSLLDFKLAGVSLPPEQKAQYTEIQTRLSQLTNQFGNNVLDATQAWTLHITDKSELEGVPEMTLATMSEAASRKALDGYLVTLDFPIYFAVMTYAENRSLREIVYRAYATRASADSDYNNHDIIREILKLRQQTAELLGFANYAELSVARKMAKSVDQVNQFLEDLIRYSRPAAEREFAELQAFAREQSGIEELKAWDVSHFSEKLRKVRYDLSQEELRVWFPVEKVKQGMFQIVQRLYGIELQKDKTAGVWHPDVEFYNIYRDGQLIARFYLDLYTREGKRGGAWMAECRARRQLNLHGTAVQQQIPVAYLVCNFAPPSAEMPALLTHRDVTTLFHEFG
ncbi:MAG TPA: M3 family metallopeptidase, partial [Pseudohongiella sp.]|nr:M3 family metallopeptidase [Pseudohongiella sp.]